MIFLYTILKCPSNFEETLRVVFSRYYPSFLELKKSGFGEFGLFLEVLGFQYFSQISQVFFGF